MTEHEAKVRWQRPSLLLTTVSFRQINFALEQHVLDATASVPVGKALHPPHLPAQHPHDNLLKLCTAISSPSDFRLHQGARRLAPGRRIRLYWMLTAVAQAAGWKKKSSWGKKAVLQHRLSEPLSSSAPTPTPRDCHWLSLAGFQTSKRVTINKRYLKIIAGNKTGKSLNLEKSFIIFLLSSNSSLANDPL